MTPTPEHIIAFVNTADALIADGADATTESFAAAVLAAVGPLIEAPYREALADLRGDFARIKAIAAQHDAAQGGDNQ